MTRDLISNHDFLAFVRDDGYEREALWSPEGWAWRRARRVTRPRFWGEPEPGCHTYRAMFDELPLPLDWPVEVNAHEAMAYCKWRGHGWRLPSEAEHQRIAALDGPGDVFDGRWNTALCLGSPSPVGQRGRAGRCTDVWGNVWQWLRDDFRPLPGFRPHRLYEDFSAPYFDGEHAALIGGSWASTGSTASRWYRLWFRRHFY